MKFVMLICVKYVMIKHSYIAHHTTDSCSHVLYNSHYHSQDVKKNISINVINFIKTFERISY